MTTLQLRDALRGLPFRTRVIASEEIIPLLATYQLLPQFSRELIVDQAIAPIECTPEETLTACQQLDKQHQIISATQRQAWLERYSAVSHLPLAVSLLTLVSGMLRAIKPLVNQFILSFGPAVTFAIGSLVMLGATAILRSVDFPATPGSSSKVSSIQPLSRSILGLIAGVGLSIE